MASYMIENRISALEEVIAVKFTDKDLVLEALLAKGCGLVLAGVRRAPEGNKPLAMIGDSTLRGLIILKYYKMGKDKGAIDDHVKRAVNNNNLAQAGLAIGLDRFVVKNPCQPGQVSPRVMADTVEALIGAAYLDGGAEVAQHVINVLKLDDNQNW